MSFFAILFALLLEQARPLGSGNPVHAALRRWVRWIMHNFDAGKSHHGGLVWGLTVLAPTLAALLVHWLLVLTWGWFAAMLWNAAILYACLGFRQFSHHFTDIRDALEIDDLETARRLLAQWRQVDTQDLSRGAIIGHVIEHSVLAAHRHVFGVLTWFTLLAALGLGPAGAVFYRLSEFVARYWPHLHDGPQALPVSQAARDMAALAWRKVDWLPARITALGFAVVGSFEEAIDGWRFHETHAAHDNDGVILAATAGAIHVRLAAVQSPPTPEADASGQEPALAHLRSMVGLVWRSVVMWMLLLALLTLARLLG